MTFSNPGIRRICLFLVFGLFAQCALADFASCVAGWEWANNSLQQNPCQIAGALDAACEGYAAFILGPLTQGSNYLTPQPNDTVGKKCNCNTVVFSLYMACTACQNVSTESWRFWSQFCDQGVYVTEYNQNIPLNTAVPHWAYLNYTIEGVFDPVAARAAGGLPESFAPTPSTIPLSSTSTSSGSLSTPRSQSSTQASPPSTTGNPTSQGGNNSTKKSSNVGAIVGGVIGGLAAIGIGAWIFLLRKRIMARGDQGYSISAGVSSGIPVSEYGIPLSRLRPYDPSDPSTYPAHVSYRPSGSYSATFNDVRYTGAPEL